MNKKHNRIIVKAALLSVCLVSCSLNAIAGIIPDMADSFPEIALSTIELATTIPSLTSMMAILLCDQLNRRFGYKAVMLFSLMLSGISASAPMVLDNIGFILVSRAIFGFGIGLMATVLLNIINAIFTGNDRSSMIGLQGAVGGLGSALETFIAGRLLLISWHTSFGVYLVAFVVFVIFLLFVPQVKYGDRQMGDRNHHAEGSGRYAGLLLLSFSMFLAVGIAMFYVIKVATWVTEHGIGQTSDGSLAVACISMGSLMGGVLYGNIYKKLGTRSLAVFYGITAAGYVISAFSSSLPMVFMASFCVGYGYMTFQPYLQEQASVSYRHFGGMATTVILIFQYLGAFAAPYFGVIMDAFALSLRTQLLILAVLIGVMAVFAFCKSKIQSM